MQLRTTLMISFSMLVSACAAGAATDGSLSDTDAADASHAGAAGTAGGASGGAPSSGGGGQAGGGAAGSSNGGTAAHGGAAGALTGGGAGTASGGTGGSYASPIVDESSFPVNAWTKTLNWDLATKPIQGEGLLHDPVRQSDFDAFYTDSSPNARHTLKSTDYGLNWVSIQQTAVAGSPWGVAIDPNPSRDPEQPPTMYTPAGYGALGLWKSKDGGVTWFNLFANCKDGVMPKPGGGTVTFPPDGNNLHIDFDQVAILNDDPPNHILITYHEPQPGKAILGESKIRRRDLGDSRNALGLL